MDSRTQWRWLGEYSVGEETRDQIARGAISEADLDLAFASPEEVYAGQGGLFFRARRCTSAVSCELICVWVSLDSEPPEVMKVEKLFCDE